MRNQHFRISNLFSLLISISSLLLLLNLGCGRTTTEDLETVAVVNEEPISLRDFQKEIVLRSKQNPAYQVTPAAIEEQLDTIINRRLMIQEAMKMGLASNEDFVRTIQTFWEQTLIRELIENKNREWGDRLFVTEQEIRDYYKKAQEKVTFKVIRTKDEKKAEEILERANKQKNTLNWEMIGPVIYFDIDHTVLKEVFYLPEGQIKILKDGDEFLVIYVEKKEDIPSFPPIEEIQSQVRSEVLERKRTKVLDEWLAEVRKKADVEINAELFDIFFRDEERIKNAEGRHGR